MADSDVIVVIPSAPPLPKTRQQKLQEILQTIDLERFHAMRDLGAKSNFSLVRAIRTHLFEQQPITEVQLKEGLLEKDQHGFSLLQRLCLSVDAFDANNLYPVELRPLLKTVLLTLLNALSELDPLDQASVLKSTTPTTEPLCLINCAEHIKDEEILQTLFQLVQQQTPTDQTIMMKKYETRTNQLIQKPSLWCDFLNTINPSQQLIPGELTLVTSSQRLYESLSDQAIQFIKTIDFHQLDHALFYLKAIPYQLASPKDLNALKMLLKKAAAWDAAYPSDRIEELHALQYEWNRTLDRIISTSNKANRPRLELLKSIDFIHKTIQAIPADRVSNLTQALTFNADAFTTDWDASETFLKGLRYQSNQLQHTVLNQKNAFGQTVLELGLMSEDAPAAIQSIITHIIQSFPTSHQTIALRALVAKYPEETTELLKKHHEWQDLLTTDQQRILEYQTKCNSAALRLFFKEYGEHLSARTLMSDETKQWLTHFYNSNKDNPLLLAIDEPDHLELFSSIIELTAIVDETLLFQCANPVVSKLNFKKKDATQSIFDLKILRLLLSHPKKTDISLTTEVLASCIKGGHINSLAYIIFCLSHANFKRSHVAESPILNQLFLSDHDLLDLLNLLRAIPSASDSDKTRIQTHIHTVSHNKTLWHRAFEYAHQHDRWMITHLLTLITALSEPMEACQTIDSSQPTHQTDPTDHSCQLITEFSNQLRQYPDQIERFLIQNNPPVAIAIRLLRLLPPNVSLAVLEKNPALQTTIASSLTPKWCQEEPDLGLVLHTQLITQTLLNESCSQRIIERMTADLEANYVWQQSIDLTNLSLNACQQLVQWHQQSIVPSALQDAFFKDNTVLETLQRVISASLQSNHPAERHQSLSLFFSLPVTATQQLLTDGLHDLAKALPTTAPELFQLMDTAIKHGSEEALITILNAVDPMHQETVERITNESGENVRFCIQRAILSKINASSLAANEYKTLLTRLERLQQQPIEGNDSQKTLLLFACLLFNAIDPDQKKILITLLNQRIAHDDCLQTLSLNTLPPHQIRIVLLALKELENNLPANFIRDHAQQFWPIQNDVFLFLQQSTPSKSPASVFYLELLWLLPRHKQRTLLANNPNLKQYLDAMLSDDWYQEQASTGNMRRFINALYLQEPRHWPFIQRWNLDTLSRTIDALSLLTAEERSEWLSRRVSNNANNNYANDNYWSNIRHEIMSTSKSLVETGTFEPLHTILSKLTDVERRDVLLFVRPAFYPGLNKPLIDLLVEQAHADHAATINAWKTDCDEHRLWYELLDAIKKTISLSQKKSNAHPFFQMLQSPLFAPPHSMTREQIARLLLDDKTLLIEVLTGELYQTLREPLLTLISHMPEDVQRTQLTQCICGHRNDPLLYPLHTAMINVVNNKRGAEQQFIQLCQMITKLPPSPENSNEHDSLLFAQKDGSGRTVLQYTATGQDAPLRLLLQQMPPSALEACLKAPNQSSLYWSAGSLLLEAIVDNSHVSTKTIQDLLELFKTNKPYSVFKRYDKSAPLTLIRMLKRLPFDEAERILCDHKGLLHTLLSNNAAAQRDLLNWLTDFSIEQQARLFDHFQQEMLTLSESEQALITQAMHQNPTIKRQIQLLQVASQSQRYLQVKRPSESEQTDLINVLQLYQCLKQSLRALHVTTSNAHQQIELLQPLLHQTRAITPTNNAIKTLVNAVQKNTLEQLAQLATLTQQIDNQAAWCALKDAITAQQQTKTWASLNNNIALDGIMPPCDIDRQGFIMPDVFINAFLAFNKTGHTEIVKRLSSVVKTLDDDNQTNIQEKAQKQLSKDLYHTFQAQVMQVSHPSCNENISSDELMMLFPEPEDQQTPDPDAAAPSSTSSATPEEIESLKTILHRAAQSGSKNFPRLFEESVLKSTSRLEDQVCIMTPIFEQYSTVHQSIKQYLSQQPQLKPIVRAYTQLRHQEATAALEKQINQYHNRHPWPDQSITIEKLEETYQQLLTSASPSPENLSYLCATIRLAIHSFDNPLVLSNWIKTLPPAIISALINHNINHNPKHHHAMRSLVETLTSIDKYPNLLTDSNGYVSKKIKFVYELIDAVPTKDKHNTVVKTSQVFFEELGRLNDGKTNRPAFNAFLLPKLFQSIKDIPTNHETPKGVHATFISQLKAHHLMRGYSTFSPTTARDLHLIELAAKVDELKHKSEQATDAKKKAHYSSAYNVAKTLHDTLLKISNEQDQADSSARIAECATKWFAAIQTATTQLTTIEKNLFQMKNLFQRLWRSMERTLGLTSVTGKPLLTELDRYGFLKQATPPTVQQSPMSQATQPSAPVEQDNSLDKQTSLEPLELVRQRSYLVSLKNLLTSGKRYNTLLPGVETRLRALHDTLLAEILKHENSPDVTELHEIQRNLAVWNREIDRASAELKKQHPSSSWLPWLFPSKDDKTIQKYQSSIQMMKMDTTMGMRR